LVLWLLGYPSQALQKSHEAITLARELSHSYSLALALDLAAELHRHRREAEIAHERAEAAMALGTDHGFAQILARGTILRGWALVEQGQGEVGIAQMRQGIAAHQATGAAYQRPHFLSMLAEVHSGLGQPEAGLMALSEALALVETTGERYYEAELHRLQGELLLQHAAPEVSHAEACFQQSLDIARRQQAKSWELRVAMSLSRLWQQQGKQAEARALLAPIYGWFTEGFDTADLQEAKALLAELGG
jgi:predicted ATPase